ncbi:MAG: UDP-N-acetylmuramoyl-L-alanine--D-glutamate ligase [Coriobacteriales bacterium]|jgi:UDP-N-acetylmuramoylalanine--D-glutamate ligase|nr:UDP-N-acetylmuramoyl-L-alanine--D-glutamate ligase [Coriobacteriales bacterium]
MDRTTGHILNREVLDSRTVRSVCVLGRGVTGEAVAAFFRAQSDPPTVTVLDDTALAAVEAKGIGPFDLAVVSPGIAPTSPLVTAVRECTRELISEPELAWRLAPERWIVVTGTNGKTTTTALTAEVLTACGMKARVAGNIGTTCIEAVQAREQGEYLVAELSSYQLAYSNSIAPDAAILLNITPDHLSWHGSFEDYRAAKLSLLERMAPTSPVVIDATLEQTRDIVRARRDAGLRSIPLGTADGLGGDMTQRCGAAEAAFVDPTTRELVCVIEGRRTVLVEAAKLAIKGEHNQENALAAAAVALALGGEAEQVATGLISFKPLVHRIEPCGSVDGVSFFNDSKATNPEAALKALASFDDIPLVVMLGGRDKNTSLDELVKAAEKTCRAVVCYGEAGARFHEAFASTARRGSLLSLREPDFRSAFATAVSSAQAGDAVLLSPACASFDEFDSYEHRGDVFKALVVALRMEREGKETGDGA